MLGAGLMLIIKPGISFAAWFFPAAMIGITVGGEASLMTVLSSYFVPNHLIATGVCVANAATLLGGAVAVTIYSVVFNSKIKKALPLKLSESVLQVGLPESSLADFLVAYTTGNPALANVPGVTPVVLSAARAAKKVAYADSFRYIWYILLAFAGICLVPALLFSPTAKYMTNEVAAPVQERRAKAGGAKATSEVKETSED
ncbi:hypothetical protein N7517_010033 [Penicillium concentricum]|uniref:Major facilitator superfamily (MFS) profile domain-containing protein n=1 Tax=Penicillium concentricum TaxID=293559 RepID=A0A9W9RIQ9_9EURO|nr:uncharacterized protein N7517_010033 [Penicillium concentricum]KAJ5360842.1 hypothetical protein N7517_010033 [Penicillium concentricum]